MQNSMEKELLFRSKPVGKAVITLAVPTVIAQLITVVYNMADTFFIGQLGDANQVAAATLAMPVFMLLTAIANLFGVGGSSMISRCLGAGERETAKRTAAFCIWMAIGVSLLYGLTVIGLRRRFLPLLGVNDATFDFCSDYVFWTVGIGALPTVMNAVLAHLLRSEGYSAQASFGVAFGGILNIALDPIFIFKFKLEIAGAAMATMLSNAIATLYFLCFVYKIRKGSVITLSPRRFTLKNGIPAEVLTVGLPSFIMTLMATFSNLALNKMISTYSNEAVAGMGVAKKIDSLAFAIAQGMTQGTLPLIGYNFSSGNRERMMKILKTLLLYCLAIALLGTALMFFGATTITRCFINNDATVAYGRRFLRIISLACPTTALNFLAIMVFQATGKRAQPLLLSLLRKGSLDIPLMLLLNALAGISGIVWATPIADVLALMVSAALLLPYLKRLTSSESHATVSH